MTTGLARVAGATVAGAVHLRNGRPNQDSLAWLPLSGEGERIVMAVSDGHGSPASPRSHLGSRFAVDVATRLLWELPRGPSSSRLTAAVAEIVAAWRLEVDEHLGRSPLSSDELDEVLRRGGQEAHRRLQSRPQFAYGATVLFAVVDPDLIALGQLGDGDVLLVAADGQVRRPLPVDERLVAHSTTSLCDDDPVGNTRTLILPSTSALVVLSTDGYANSFADDTAFLQVGQDLLRTIERSGISQVRQSMPQWLGETTEQGAGDDISVTVAVTGSFTPRRSSELQKGQGRPAAEPVRARSVPAAAATARKPALPASAHETLYFTTQFALAESPPGFPRRTVMALRRHRARVGSAAGLMTVAGLAAVLAVLAGSFLFLTSREPKAAQVAEIPSAPAIATSGPRIAMPVEAQWEISGGTILVRHVGSSVTRLELGRPVINFLPVPGGVLLLLKDGEVGRVSTAGPMRTDEQWPRFEATQMISNAGEYYLLGQEGSPAWRVNPDTGAVTALAGGQTHTSRSAILIESPSGTSTI